jgi:alpha-L-arabinofuranosidase
MLEADPKLVLLAAATPDRGWTLPLLKAAGEHLDYVCIHEYWLGLWQQNDKPGYVACIMLSEGPERTIRGTCDILREAGALGRIKIAFDEWNLRGWHHPGFPRKQVEDGKDPAIAPLIARREENSIDSQYSMADALFCASFLNACLRHPADVGMANISPLVNTRGPLHVHPGGIVKRTTFHVLAMYADLLGSRVGKLDVEAGSLMRAGSSIPMVDAIATVDESGKTWSIALVNRHPEKAVTCAIRMKDAPLDGRHAATILSGDAPEAFNDIEHPARVAPERVEVDFEKEVVGLRAHSLTIIRIPAR